MLSLSRDGIRESCHKHDSPLSVTTPASTSSFLVRALLPSPAVIAAIAAFVATLSRPDNADTLWHLAIGRWISIQRALPDIGSFYYSTVAGSGHNYSWLSQVILSGAYRFLGGAGVAILTSVIAGSIFYFLHKLLEQHGTGRSETGNQSNMLVNFTVLGLALTTIAVYLTGRPMMFTVAFFTLELVILSDFVHSRSKLIWLIPPMTALWANLHPGFVIAPLVILAFVPLVRETRDRWTLVACLVVSIGAVALNPYGLRLYLMPFETTRSLSLLRRLSEWQGVSGWIAVIWGGLIALVTCGLSLRRQPLPIIALTALTGLVAGLSVRNMPLFGVITVYVISRTLLPAIMPALRRIGFIRRFDVQFKPAGGWFWAIAIPAVLIGAVRLQFYPGNLEFDYSSYPEAAVSFIGDQDLPDNVFVRERWSGYLLQTMPERKLFYDAKGGFSPEAVREHVILIRAKPGWRDIARRNHISTFLLERDSPLALVLNEAPDWDRVYSDALSEVFVRARQKETE